MKLEKINWSQTLSIGNADIDTDHKEILDIYNGLIDMIDRGSNREDCAKFLNEMTNYALYHFRKEENYMKNFSYPKLSQHRHFHMEYIYEVSMFNVVFTRTDHFKPENMVVFIKNWWTEHIQKADRDYENYKQQVRSPVRYE